MKSRRTAGFMPALTIAIIAMLLSSCLGIDSRIKISRDGSGTVGAEYRLSQELVAFGELESNRSMLPVPLTRADLENSLKGAKGLSLKSWTSAPSGTDLLIKVAIDFDSIASLVYYLDPRGELARHETLPDGKNRIQFSMGEKMPPLDPDMKTIATQSFLPYSFKFAIETPTAPVSAKSDHPSIAARIDGKTALFEGRMSDIVSTEIAPKMELTW